MFESWGAKKVPRRTVLRRFGAAGGAVLLWPWVSGCDSSSKSKQDGPPIVRPTTASSPTSQSPPGTKLDIYLPNWLEDPDYQRIGRIDTQAVSRFILSFAIPGSDSKVSLDPMSNALQTLATASRSHSAIGLSVGGYGGDDSEHTAILNGWKAAMENPNVFASSVAAAAESVDASSIDLDFEYPTTDQTSQFVHLISILRKKLPQTVAITLAVPADTGSGSDSAGFTSGIHDLSQLIDTFHVMTYDNAGPWSDTAGDIAPGQWVINSIGTWVGLIGNDKQVSVGYPAYGYTFPGAKQRGDRFNQSQAAQVLYKDVPPAIVKDDMQMLTSEAIINGAWTALQSPAVMQAIHNRVTQLHPNVGAFLFAADGTVAGHITALTSRPAA